MLHPQGVSNEPNHPNFSHCYLPISLRSILILSSHLRLGIPKALSLSPVGVPVKILKALLASSILSTWPTHLNLLDNHSDYIRWTIEYMKFLTVKAFPLASLLGPNIRLRILFSNILSLRSSLHVRDHASHPYSTTGNIIVLYTLVFKFLERSREDKRDWTE